MIEGSGVDSYPIAISDSRRDGERPESALSVLTIRLVNAIGNLA
jgi:hypothetical protein